MAERLRLLATTGVDAVLVLPFDAALARLSAREFTLQHSGRQAARARAA